MIDKLANDIARAAQIKLAALSTTTTKIAGIETPSRLPELLAALSVGGIAGGLMGALGQHAANDPEDRLYLPAILRGAGMGMLGHATGRFINPKDWVASGLLTTNLGLMAGGLSPNKKEYDAYNKRTADKMRRIPMVVAYSEIDD